MIPLLPLLCLCLPSISLAATHNLPLSRRSLLVPNRRLSPPERAVRFSTAEEKQEAFDRIGREAERVRRKYGRGLLKKDAEGESMAMGMEKRTSASVALEDADQDLEYFVLLNVGTPGQPINVTVDTGSSDLWMQTSSCTTGCYSNLTSYNPTSSSSYTSTSTPVEITYGSGSAQGTLGYDTVALGTGLSVTHAGIVLASELDDLLEADVPVSGLMGFGWQNISSSGAMPYWQSLMTGNGSTTSLDQPAFSVALGRAPGQRTDQQAEGEVDPGGSLIIGGWDETQISGGINTVEWNTLIAEGYWEIAISQLHVNGQSISVSAGSTGGDGGQGGSGPPTAAIDTGTTLIAAPPGLADSVYEVIPQGQAVQGNQGLFAYPYNEAVNVSFTFSNQAWPVSAEDFCYFSFVDASGGGDESTWCVGCIYNGGSSLADSDVPDWIIGDSFLKNVYAIFRGNPAAVGFGVLSNPGTTTTPTGSSVTGGVTGGSSSLGSVSFSGSASFRSPTQTGSAGSSSSTSSGSSGSGGSPSSGASAAGVRWSWAATVLAAVTAAGFWA